MTNPAGYSGTPLIKKLGIKPEHEVAVINSPKPYTIVVNHEEDWWEIATPKKLTGEYSFIHLFCANEAELISGLPICVKHLSQGGMIWASWPKKSSELWVDLTEGGIRKAAFPLGLVDVKVCAVDKDWSALKLMRRRK